ncbi:Preprotein translocase subunit SecY [Buchnera aphidicola (Anoecia corni)]|uniref:Protein translocase subunit SecY n=1 Tax=Buchnera aphidicola (Anoecia corni) TaxID=2994477 RepID=A0AAT9IH14_9GAMM
MEHKLINYYKNYNKGIIELKRRTIFFIFSIIVFRIGSFIPIPGINIPVLSKIIYSNSSGIFDIFNMFSGGSLSRASIFALGIMPYISASIIIQVLTLAYPTFSKLKKEGELGSKKINKYVRYLTLFLAIFQAVGLATSLPFLSGMKYFILNPDIYFYFIAIFSLISGSLFLMWLSELITEYGLGNGTSILIFISILSGFPSTFSKIVNQFHNNEYTILQYIVVMIIIVLSIFFVVFTERCQRQITIRYAGRQRGSRIYSTQNTHLPLKLNMSGVMPAIFSSSMLIFPSTIASWYLGKHLDNLNLLCKIILFFKFSHIFYILLYATSIVFFCFFYSQLAFNPRETADNLKKSGAFIPGIRPGEKTEKYISNIMLKLTCIGSVYMIFICLMPEFIKNIFNMPFYFGGTSLLIVVVVIIDFITQIQTLILSNQYDVILKKSNLYFNNKKK